MKRIVILGSTGSIGESSLDVIARLGEEYKVVGLAANTNHARLLEQINDFKPQYVCLSDPEASRALRNSLPRWTKLLEPEISSLMFLASLPEADLVVHGLSGGIGFAPLVASLKAGKLVALANKEPMVMAGSALMKECDRWEAGIIPVDSEASAIFQCLQSGDDQIARILLTASGGPFLKYKGSFDKITPAQALAHPRWKMGRKISVDSATLMNKGFEAIEIHHLFSVPMDDIKVVVHPQSSIHSAVQYNDGSIMAQMSVPDMRLPIQYSITYPDRVKSPVSPLDLARLSEMTFMSPDLSRFPCLTLAVEAGKYGGTFPAALSAADEEAVAAFLDGRIKFTDIALVVEEVLSSHSSASAEPSLSAAVEADQWAREKARSVLGGMGRVKGKRK